MNGRGHEDDVLPLLEQLLALASSLQSRIHELALDLPIVLEIGQRRGIRDDRDDERPAEDRFPDRANGDARTRFVERREVIGDLLPARQVAVSARLEAEDRLGRGNGGSTLS